jgi:hypothetical protein
MGLPSIVATRADCRASDSSCARAPPSQPPPGFFADAKLSASGARIRPAATSVVSSTTENHVAHDPRDSRGTDAAGGTSTLSLIARATASRITTTRPEGATYSPADTTARVCSPSVTVSFASDLER